MRFAKITDGTSSRGEQRKLRCFFAELLPQPTRCFEQRRSIEQLAGLQHSACSFDSVKPALRIHQGAKTEFVGGTQPLPGFANERKRGFQRNAIRSRLERIHRSPSRRTRGPQPQQFPQLVELEYFLRGASHLCFYFSLLWRCCAASPAEAATYTSRPFASPHGPG